MTRCDLCDAAPSGECSPCEARRLREELAAERSLRADWHTRMVVAERTAEAVIRRAEKYEAKLAAAREVLRDAEWSGHRGWGPPCCIDCERFDPDQLGEYAKYPKVQDLTGHAHDCRLAAVLRET